MVLYVNSYYGSLEKRKRKQGRANLSALSALSADRQATGRRQAEIPSPRPPYANIEK